MRHCLKLQALVYTLLVLTALPIFAAARTVGATFSCPDGSSLLGAAPPKGEELKCVNSEGKLDGPYRHWYPNGQLMESLNYKQGKQHGEQRAWWPNGQLMMEGTSIKGKRYKTFKYWDINGNPRQIETPTITSEIELKSNQGEAEK